MKNFSKEELIGILIIFLVLIGISLPNFSLSLRRSRDQVRRDDLGVLVHAIDEYSSDFATFPKSLGGSILACKRPEDKVEIDKKGRLIVDLIPCQWGRDSLIDLTPGSTIVYLKTLPQDPDSSKGVSYYYVSDGSRYQIFGSYEGMDEAEYDPQVVARNIMCGTRVCNVGRSLGCEINKTLAQCEIEAIKK